MAESVRIQVNEEVTLEGEYRDANGETGAVLLHPHPLYGGSMRNNVVAALERACGRAGISTLAVNFRGVEGSSGNFDNGRGEVDDVVAAAGWLGEMGTKRLILMGYSFGAMVGLSASGRAPGLAAAVWVAPPLIMGPLPDFGAAVPMLAIAGERDEFAPAKGVEFWCARQGALAEFRLFPGGDHFFFGRESELCDFVEGFLKGL